MVNLCASMTFATTGLNVFRFGWAFEIFLLAGFLAGIMWAVQKHWMLVPIIILLGNAMILSYCAITARWSDWIFLWMLEPFIIGTAVITPLTITRTASDPRFWARASGGAAILIVLVLSSFTCSLGLLVSFFR